MKFDTDLKGLETCFLPWQVECWHAIWGIGEPFGSLDVWERADADISRASVINFLAWMVNEGFLEYRSVVRGSTRMGEYNVFERFSDSETLLKRALNVRMSDHLKEHLPWNHWIDKNE